MGIGDVYVVKIPHVCDPKDVERLRSAALSARVFDLHAEKSVNASMQHCVQLSSHDRYGLELTVAKFAERTLARAYALLDIALPATECARIPRPDIMRVANCFQTYRFEDTGNGCVEIIVNVKANPGDKVRVIPLGDDYRSKVIAMRMSKPSCEGAVLAACQLGSWKLGSYALAWDAIARREMRAEGARNPCILSSSYRELVDALEGEDDRERVMAGLRLQRIFGNRASLLADLIPHLEQTEEANDSIRVVA